MTFARPIYKDEFIKKNDLGLIPHIISINCAWLE